MANTVQVKRVNRWQGKIAGQADQLLNPVAADRVYYPQTVKTVSWARRRHLSAFLTAIALMIASAAVPAYAGGRGYGSHHYHGGK